MFINPNITSSKSVDLGFANIGDILNYTVVINNSGDTDATSVNLTDLIPQGANFVANSVFVNGIQQSGIDPALGINLSTISIGNTTTVTMKALVVTLPISNPILNTGQLDYQYIAATVPTTSIVTASIDTSSSATTISTPLMSLTKSTDKTSVGIGTSITYRIDFENDGTTTANNLVFIDTIPTGTTFVPNSLVVFSTTTVPGASPAPPSGFSFGSLQNGFASHFTFQVVVTSITPSRNIVNFSDATYTFTVNPRLPNGASSRVTSNVLSTTISIADLSGTTKSVNQSYAKCGDILIYTINIPNSGTTTATNVIVTDTVPNGTTFVTGSISVNGVSVGGVPTSINVGAIPAGGSSTVSFNVQVTC